MDKIEIAFDDTATYACPYCSEENEIIVDPTEGLHQKFVEDCWVCCHPLVVHVDIDIDARRAVAFAETE